MQAGTYSSWHEYKDLYVHICKDLLEQEGNM